MESNFNKLIDKFENLQTEEDFLNLLNETSISLYGEKCIRFKLSQIRYHSNVNLNQKRYVSFDISKKSGGKRTIHAPNKTLKSILICLNHIFQEIYKPHINAFGFIPNKSIIDNAKKHVNRNYVFNADLKDFFPSIDQARIWERLKYPPFNLSDDKLKIRNLIAGLVCHSIEVERIKDGTWIKEIRNVLPQGSPMSPIITNIICERLDRKLTGIAKRFGIHYSRYADDITFSSDHNVYQANGDFMKNFEEAVRNQNFHIKTSKTRLQKRGYRQEVTGIVVNESTNVKRDYIKTIRLWLYRWEKLGYDEAYKLFLDQYLKDKGHLRKNLPIMEKVIGGKLLYLKMVVGANNYLYKKLNERFINLIQDFQNNENIEKFIDLRLNEKKKIFYDTLINIYINGIDIALKHFNSFYNENFKEKDLESLLIRFRKSLSNNTLNDMLGISELMAELGIKVEGQTFYNDYLKILYDHIKIDKNIDAENEHNHNIDLKLNERIDSIIYSLTRKKVDVILDIWEIYGLDELISFDIDKKFVDLFVENLQDLRQTLKKI